MGVKALVLQAEKDSLPVTDEEVDADIDNQIRYFINMYGSKDELEKIGILVKGKRLFRTISGERVERTFGYAWFTYDGVSGGSEVVFAEPNDGNVLGALAMEGMGLKVDPKNGKIITEDVFLAL